MGVFFRRSPPLGRGYFCPREYVSTLGKSAKENRGMRTKQVFGRMGSRSPLYVGILGLLLATAPAKAQDAAPPQGAGQMQRPDEGRGRGVAGKITSLKDGALELTRMDGATVTVKL